MKTLTNAGTVQRAAIERILVLMQDADNIREDLKELRAEFKGREDDMGCKPAELFKAAALHRKGPAEAASKLAMTIDMLRAAGFDAEAADLALS